jgi:uncharacterized repeat protein (TIGR01451 family)
VVHGRLRLAVCATFALFTVTAGGARASLSAVRFNLEPYPLLDAAGAETTLASLRGGATQPAPAVVGHTGGGDLLGPIEAFEGIRNEEQISQGAPPDTEGAVGQDEYVQWVNTSFAVYDKQGLRLFGPVPGNVLWSGMSSTCATSNRGDPTVLYDERAAQWIFAQWAYSSSSGPYYECLAVSVGSNPTGSYTRYVFEIPPRVTGSSSYPLKNDTMKLGVWGDTYVLTDVQFLSSGNPAGTGVFVLDRPALLSGEAAGGVYFDLPDDAPALPADVEGRTAPPTTDPLLVEVPDATDSTQSGHDELTLRRLHVSFGANGTASMGAPVLLETPDSFPTLCKGSPHECVPQKGTPQTLDPVADRPMFRAAYRSFGLSGKLVVLRTVGLGSPPRAALRWYTIDDVGGTVDAAADSLLLSDYGMYAPDNAFRWMGSAAMDMRGDIGLGFSVSDSASSYPSVSYSGIRAGDDAVSGEGSLAVGGASQLWSNRWGDYSSLSVDPVDRCTFWYTQEYYPAGEPVAAEGRTPWHTRIGSFRFRGCGATPRVDVDPVAGAREGTTVTADPGDWSSVPGVTLSGLSYEWRRCDADGGGCVPISGGNGRTYVLTSRDVDSRIRVAVRASSPLAGVASSLSPPTAVVTPVPATVPVTLVATADTPPPDTLGTDVVYTVRVANASSDATATNVVLTDTPPPGVDVVSAVPDRGPGCGDLTARPLDCDLTFLPASRTATVRIEVRPLARGRFTNSVSVRADQAAPTASVGAVASVTANPVVMSVGTRRLTRPRRGPAKLRAALTVDEGATLTAKVVPAGRGAPIPLLRGSRFGAATLSTSARSIKTVQQAAGELGLVLRLAPTNVHPGNPYTLLVVATDADGLTTTVRLPLRARRPS